MAAQVSAVNESRMKKLYLFYQLPCRTRWLLVEAFCLLGVTRAASFWLPFRYLAPYLGRVPQESEVATDLLLAGHAWLRAETAVMTGGGDLGRYKQVACFGAARGAS